MLLSRLYTNLPNLFEPISFVDGLNVVVAEIRLPENKDKDVHNLGKSTLGKVIDFCLLMGKSKKFFLFEKEELFRDFVFFVELKLLNGEYLTVRRSVAEATKISFKLNRQSVNVVQEGAGAWDHTDIAFDRAKQMLDSYLALDAIKPWGFRKIVGYLLRGQSDYSDVFKLAAFQGAHSGWKPFLSHILGFDSDSINRFYEQEQNLEEQAKTLKTVQVELAGFDGNASKIEGLLQLRKKEAEQRAEVLKKFNFADADQRRTEILVGDIDNEIAQLNKRRYSLRFNRKRIADTLQKEQIEFDPDKAQELFREANIFFEGQIKRDFDQLIEFNRSITSERKEYLKEELKEINAEINAANERLNTLSELRSANLAFLGETDAFAKFKELSEEQAKLQTEIGLLEKQKEYLGRIREIQSEIKNANEKKDGLRDAIQADVVAQNADETSLFSRIRFFFNDIVRDVIDCTALLSAQLNAKDHVDFAAEILDEQGNVTSASDGNSYKKLLCIAFDLAILRAHREDPFPRFAFHDGVFETLDPRKKSKLLSELRHYAELGMQLIITTLDSDIPVSDGGELEIDEDEIVLRLHDEGKEGRLFKVRSW